MIIIHTLEEAHQLYRQGIIPFRLLQDQAMLFINVCSPQPGRYIEEATEISDSDVQWLLTQPEAEEEYNGFLGGEFYVCEVEDDLKQIVGMDMEFAKAHGNRWPDVTELVMSWDQCKYLDADWAMFLLCWNDAGGPVYYVPKHLWLAARMAEHIAATDHHWA